MPEADSDEGRIQRWLETNVGGRVLSLVRQNRWRPVWFADVERDGERLELCVRGDRTDTRFGFTLEHEMRFQKLLHEHGIPVARVYGWCEEPAAYVMDRVVGSSEFGEEGREYRRGVMHHYVEILADIHRLPLEPFVKAEIIRAPTPAAAAAIGMQTYEDAYRVSKKRPDPFLEFCLAWLKRNPLDNKGRESVVVWDSGQFHQHEGRIAAVLDLELGHIGDPMMDLAGLRMRDSIIGYGDFNDMYDHYAAITGESVDLHAIRHHHFCFTLTNQLAFHAALAEPTPDSDYMTNMQWCSETNLYAVEALAEILGIELDEVPVPKPRTPSPGAGAHAHLVRSLRNLDAGSEFAQHQIRIAFRLARHLQRSDEIGDQVVESNLDDLGALLGHRPATWQEGDAELEAFVGVDDGRHDAELIQLFHRRLQRYRMLLGPAGSAMARHNPIQTFDL
jgi:aminoglycoside phosphotransferase (APT) family kinase protein